MQFDLSLFTNPTTFNHSAAIRKTYVFMVDTRAPTNHTQTHTMAAAIANHYSARYHYHFLYFIANCPHHDTFYDDDPHEPLPCKGHRGINVPTPWMKVKGILEMLSMMDDDDRALYIDTDVLMNHSHSIDDFIQNDLINGSTLRGIAVCWDYASFWTSYALNVYRFPINSGIILFRKTKSVQVLMDKWWESVAVPSKMDRNPMDIVDERNESRWNNHALQWPFEQDRLSWIVDTQLFHEDIVLFKEDRRVHPSMSNHLTTLEDEPGHYHQFIVNYTKLVFIRQCENGYIEWYHRRVVLDGCDANFSESFLRDQIDHWSSASRLTTIHI